MARIALITPSALRTLSRPDPPPDLHPRIVAAIRAEAEGRKRRRRIWRAAIGAIAVLTLMLVLRDLVR
jgi:hypothetical protein